MEGEELKEWVSLKHSPTGTLVTVSLVQGNRSVKWTEKASVLNPKTALKRARTQAREMLAALETAMAELDEEAA